jgi:hypothetical protein
LSRHTVTTLTINDLHKRDPSHVTAQTVTAPSQLAVLALKRLNLPHFCRIGISAALGRPTLF